MSFQLEQESLAARLLGSILIVGVALIPTDSYDFLLLVNY